MPDGAVANAFAVPTSALFGFGELDQNKFLSLDVACLWFHVSSQSAFTVDFHANAFNNRSRFALLYGEQVGTDVDDNGIVGSNRNYAAGANCIADNSGNLPRQETVYDRGFRSYVAAVPEPSDWAMLIAGFGIVGPMHGDAARSQPDKKIPLCPGSATSGPQLSSLPC